jgi:hypothetical protein
MSGRGCVRSSAVIGQRTAHPEGPGQFVSGCCERCKRPIVGAPRFVPRGYSDLSVCESTKIKMRLQYLSFLMFFDVFLPVHVPLLHFRITSLPAPDIPRVAMHMP